MEKGSDVNKPEFKTPLVMKPLRDPEDFSEWDGRLFQLTCPLEVTDSKGRPYTIPRGFVFNGVTTRPLSTKYPEWLKDIIQFVVEIFVKPIGVHLEAACWHDYVYTNARISISREECDREFYEMLQVCGLSNWWAKKFLSAVKRAGAGGWTKREYIF